MIAGGSRKSTGPTIVNNKVFEYDIDSDSYKEIQPLDAKMYQSTMVRKDVYMYYFAGSGQKSVFRIHLDLEEDWEQLEDLQDKGKELLVVPYN